MEDDNEDEDPENEDDGEELKEEQEDAIVKSIEYRVWKSLAKANKSVIDLLCEIVALASSEEEDQDFEEVDDEEETKNSSMQDNSKPSSTENIIDTDQIKQFCIQLLRQYDYFNKVVLRAEAIPQYLGLPQEVETIMNDVQESSFGLLYNII